MTMNIKYLAITLPVLLFFFCACKKKVEAESGELKGEVVSQQNTTNESDSIVDEWGEPAPPPEMGGDGSSLFQERFKKPAKASVDDEAQPSNDEVWDSDDRIQDRIQSDMRTHNSVPSSAPTTSRSNSRRTVRTNDPEFDYSPVEYVPPTTSGSGGGLLPYAANDQEKMDFLRGFYKDFFANGGQKIDESALSASCKRFLNDKSGEHGIDNVAQFFTAGIQNGNAETANSMKLKSIGDDWFRVSNDDGKHLDIKVVEFNGHLQIDMLKIK